MAEIKPVVSIIMATFNRAHLIRESLGSILDQSYENWECLVIDDGSTDTTSNFVADFIMEDTRLNYYLRTEKYRKGLPGCRNYGLDLAKGKFVVFFDDDDIVHPDNLKICVENFSQRKISYCRYRRQVFTGDFDVKFDRKLEYSTAYLNSDVLEDVVTNRIPFNSCQVMWRRECFMENRFNEALFYAEEWECYSRILATGISGISVDKTLFYGRKHLASNTGEFGKKDPIRKASKVEASQLIIMNLRRRGLLNSRLQKFFIRMAFSLQEKSLLRTVLIFSELNFLQKKKYQIGFRFYSVLRPFFNIKGSLKKKMWLSSKFGYDSLP